MAVPYTIPFKKNFNAPTEEEPLGTDLYQGDKNATILRIELMDGDQKADLTDMSVTGELNRPDGVIVPLTGSINSNVVHVTLTAGCYNVAGAVDGMVQLTTSTNYTIRTILKFTSKVVAKGNGPILDASKLYPSIDTLIEKVDALDAELDTKFQTGVLTVAAEAGVVSSQNVTFPTAFSSMPAVVVHLNTNATAVLDGGACAPSGISATGFTVNVFRKTAGNVPVRWMAFKP